MGSLVEGIDYYIEDGRWVFTAEYLRDRGYCCGSGCRHCPYRPTPDRPPAVGRVESSRPDDGGWH